MSSFGFFDIIIVLSGAYLIYIAIKMKKTGDLTNSPIIGKGCDIHKAKDPQGFIDYMYMKSIILGVITILGGVIDFLNEEYLAIPYFSLAICVVFLLVIIVYCKLSMDAQKKYLAPKPFDKNKRYK